MAEEHSLVKIGFRDADDQVETPWASDLGQNRYQLENSLWFYYGVSYQDIVEALPEEDGFLFFTRVLEKSGHRTVRVALTEAATRDLLEHINSLGATYEGATPQYIAINIPPEVELGAVTGFLSNEGIEWEYADPTYDEIMGEATR